MYMTECGIGPIWTTAKYDTFDLLDGKEVGDGRIMKVRFAPSHAAIKVQALCI
jgi:hypothetical protein